MGVRDECGRNRFGASQVEPLTRREREVLALLAEGLTSPEIAERLTLATSSVKSHLQHVYGKLGASSKREAVARARELGLLPKPTLRAGEQLPAQPAAAAHSQPQPSGTLTFLFADLAGLAFSKNALARPRVLVAAHRS